MKKYESYGMLVNITDNKLKIEIPIKNLVNAFNLAPGNLDNTHVMRGKRKEFANYLAQQLLDTEDPDTGNNLIMNMFDSIFENIMESAEDEFIKYGEDYD